jgi:hypothetical protein
MSNKPPAQQVRPPVPMSVKANRLRGAAGVPYRTAKLKRVFKLTKP